MERQRDKQRQEQRQTERRASEIEKEERTGRGERAVGEEVGGGGEGGRQNGAGDKRENVQVSDDRSVPLALTPSTLTPSVARKVRQVLMFSTCPHKANITVPLSLPLPLSPPPPPPPPLKTRAQQNTLRLLTYNKQPHLPKQAIGPTPLVQITAFYNILVSEMNPIEAEQFRYSAKFRIISLPEARRFMRLARTKDSTLRRVLFQVVLKASFIGTAECEHFFFFFFFFLRRRPCCHCIRRQCIIVICTRRIIFLTEPH